MTIKIQLPFDYRSYANNQEIIEVNGTTVNECFSDLASQCPEIREVIFSKDGSMSNLVPVYKNEDYFQLMSPSAPVSNGDILKILFMGAG